MSTKADRPYKVVITAKVRTVVQVITSDTSDEMIAEVSDYFKQAMEGHGIHAEDIEVSYSPVH